MYTIEHAKDFEKKTKAQQEREWWELRKANRGSRLREHRVANPFGLCGGSYSNNPDMIIN
jgi:hypothetical protein